jgi:chondroitinase B-like protein/ricin-type beta-trefoil lectin protein
MRISLSVLRAAAVGAAVNAIAATPAAAQLSGYYRIMARHSGKAVVVQGASTADGANVIQWTYGGTATNDEWELRAIDSGYYRIINRNSGKDLVVQSASTANGANVFQYTYGGSASNDEWQPVDLGNGYHRIVNRNSGKVLDVSAASTADGANVDQWSWVNVNQEMFQLVSLSGAVTPTATPTPTPAGPTPTPTPTPTPVSGGCVTVSSSSALSSAVSGAGPGDCILVADGSYAGFTVTADGTSTSPITIRAVNRGAATLSSGNIFLNGANWVTIEGFRITTPGGSRSMDNTTRAAAVFFYNSNNSRLTRCTLRLSGQASGTHWVYLGGNSNNNRIDHCDFGTGTVKGFYIYPSGNSQISGVTAPSKGTSTYQSWAYGGSPFNPNMARNTRIDRNYFHDKAGSTGEVITLGGIGVTGDYQDTFSIVENNLFVNCDGDAEMIASKSSSNTIRLNTVRTSVGMISLRAGNKCKVQDNLQLQAGKSGTAGIKIYEHDHTITGNYVDNPTDYPLLIGAGDSYLSSTFAHAACERCIMDGNIAINLNARPAIIGHGGSGVAPKDSTFRNNQLRGSLSSLISTPNPGDTIISGNTTSGSNPPLPRAPLTTSDVGPNAP